MVRPPRITVVTPSYQQAAYLRDTIESVLQQNYPQLEYIVVDGGSTDGSVDIIRSYSDRLAWWVSEPDSGQAEAINKGLARSSGEILAYLNSDDYYFPGAIHAVVEAFLAHPEADIIWGQGEFVSEIGKPLRTVGQEFEHRHLLDGGMPNPLPQPAVFVRRRVYERIGGFDANLHYVLDYEFFCRAFGIFRGTFIPQKLAALRQQPAAKSFTGRRSFALEIVRNAEKAIASPENYPNLDVEAARVRSAAFMVGARYLYNNGNYSEAFRWLRRSLRLSRRFCLTIALREMPRLVFHAVFGTHNYNRIGHLLQWRPSR